MNINNILIPKIKEFFPLGEENKGEWICLNPLRNDKNAGSFSINLTTGLWNDFADNSSGNLVKLICDMKKIRFGELANEYGFTVEKQKQLHSNFHHFKLGYPNAIYPYHNTEGNIVGYVCRFETKTGKELRPYSNNKWSKEGFPVPHPLYNCHKLPGKKILIVEGEKTTNAVQQLLGEDFVVLTWLGGASAIHKSNWAVLSNFCTESIYLWPDNDEPGIKAMQQIYNKIITDESISLKQPEIKIIDISSLSSANNLPKGWDLADTDESWTREKIVSILEQQPKKIPKHEISENVLSLMIEHDPRRWLDMWFVNKKIEIKPGEVIEMNGIVKTMDNLISEMNCDFITYKPEKTRINLPVLKNALDLKLTAMTESSRQEVISKMKYKYDINQNMKKFVLALIGKDDEIIEAVLKHYVWQSKRKMFGLEVFDHLMPILYGSTQRQGKSSAVKKFLSPINGLWCNAKLCDISDERKAKMFSNNFGAFFDEMQGASKLDMECIKERITGEFISFRALFTNVVSQLKNNSTPIGVTNKPLALILRDYTGMRRFFEIEITQRCDWDSINKIDFLALWLSVDENLDIPYIESFRSQIEAHQELSRDKCSVEQWIEENELTRGNMRNILNDVYSHYTHFCRNSGIFTDSKRIFGLKLKSLLQLDSKAINGARFYFLNKLLAAVFGL